jgi:hypothetical protein
VSVELNHISPFTGLVGAVSDTDMSCTAPETLQIPLVALYMKVFPFTSWVSPSDGEFGKFIAICFVL